MRGLVLALLLTGCTYQPEVTVLVGPKRVESEVDAGLTLSVMQRFGGRGVCGWTHGSDVSHGTPFNDKPELVFDHAGCGVRWGGRRR
jgi:hypothetical protein